MKKVLCFLSILFFLKAQAFAILPNGIEKGDTIYRNLTLTSLEYHAGIYRYFMEGAERDALNENDHEIREQTPSGTRTNTLYNFKHEAPFRYARTKNLTVQQRNKIIEKAYSPDLVKPYIESSILPWISFWYATIEWDKDIDDKDNDDEVEITAIVEKDGEVVSSTSAFSDPVSDPIGAFAIYDPRNEDEKGGYTFSVIGQNSKIENRTFIEFPEIREDAQRYKILSSLRKVDLGIYITEITISPLIEGTDLPASIPQILID